MYVVGSIAAPEADGCRFDYGVAELDIGTLEMRPLTASRAMFV